MQFDSIVAVFRPGQRGFLGPYLDRLDTEQPVRIPAGQDHGDTTSTTVPPGQGEGNGDGDPVAGNAGFGANGNQPKDNKGITARAIAGSGNRRRPNDVYPTPMRVIESLAHCLRILPATQLPSRRQGQRHNHRRMVHLGEGL